ncbi:DNA polymerase III subunit delta [Thalassotalea euphylliae]|uniref:DNA polymerase III subunit delta n=1 Tax=Thalassotalea euphylliae TaxID=1655234 RepID=A0A3E0TNP2_9GAMM|nr:DNA polymerase III subunit delta [Thalassotalea euphylliae]REL26186.1 DNA polymerase III subunit delta [Thalassotalea euphylliae]
MRIYHNQLSQTLSQPLSPVWLVFGDEPWQKNDSLAQIKAAALQQGFDELIRFSVDDKFSWDDVLNEYNAMSLFAARRVIELEFLTTKLNDSATKAIELICSQLSPDVALLCHGDKLDGNATKKKWFKTLSGAGVYLPIYDLDSKGLAMWLNRQVRQYQLVIDKQGHELLLTMFEGNVLALDQELQKLSILFGQQAIDFDTLSELIISQAKFNPFALVDALLTGKLDRCVTMLDQQQQEGTPAAKIQWFINKELNQLKQMHYQLQAGESQQAVFKAFRIWDKRKPLYQHAITNMSLDNILVAIARLADVDLVSKTTSEFNIFQLLADVCICAYHGEKLKPLSLNYYD